MRPMGHGLNQPSIRSRMRVIVHVCLTEVLAVSILVRIVIVVHGRVIVLMDMGCRHVLPIRTVPLVMDHVDMWMVMHHGIVVMKSHRPTSFDHRRISALSVRLQVLCSSRCVSGTMSLGFLARSPDGAKTS
jgi:hypothetical protein